MNPKWQLHSSGRTESSTMDRHQQIGSNLSKSIALSSPTRLPTSDWPAFDKPPHYYASQNNCNVKMISADQQPAAAAATSRRSQQAESTEQQEHQNSLLASIQRKLFAVLYIYAILIVSLYLTYAAYYFLQQHQRQSLAVSGGGGGGAKARASVAQELRGSDNTMQDAGAAGSSSSSESVTAPSEIESKLETKLHLLERYMELIAIDLQETKEKLRERERCDCSVSCHFNGTRYEDRSSWQQQCDICTCQMGKISCQPKKCPPLKCQLDQAVTLSGQCCPTCMRQCKYNKTLYKHGEEFQPASKATTMPALSRTKNNQTTSTKICQCLDGLIKCEQKLAAPMGDLRATSSDRVLSSSRQQAAQTTTAREPTLGERRKTQASSDRTPSQLEPKAAPTRQQTNESPPPLPAADQMMPL